MSWTTAEPSNLLLSLLMLVLNTLRRTSMCVPTAASEVPGQRPRFPLNCDTLTQGSKL